MEKLNIYMYYCISVHWAWQIAQKQQSSFGVDQAIRGSGVRIQSGPIILPALNQLVQQWQAAEFVKGAAVFFIPTRTVATRGIPSGPAWSSSMRASGHVAGAVSSVRNAMSPILGVGPPVCHLERGWSVCRYSFDQRHQKPSTIFCRSAHLRRDDTFASL